MEVDTDNRKNPCVMKAKIRVMCLKASNTKMAIKPPEARGEAWNRSVS